MKSVAVRSLSRRLPPRRSSDGRLGSGCASKPKCAAGEARLLAADHADLRSCAPRPARCPDFRQMFSKDPAVLAALDESIAYFKKPSSQKYFPYQTADSTITHEMQLDGLQTLRRIIEVSQTPDEFHGRIMGAFDVYRSVGWDGRGVVLFTGYYTPIFDGSLSADARFRYPLYRRPADLVSDENGVPKGRRMSDGQVVSYYSRNEIERDQHPEGPGARLALRPVRGLHRPRPGLGADPAAGRTRDCTSATRARPTVRTRAWAWSSSTRASSRRRSSRSRGSSGTSASTRRTSSRCSA